jgi:hypothetical protein
VTDRPFILPAGVVGIPPSYAPAVLDAIAFYVRREQSAAPALVEVAALLAAVSLPNGADNGGRNVTGAPEWLTVNEYAKGAGVSPRTARDRCQRGVIPGAERIEGRWRIPVSATLPPH